MADSSSDDAKKSFSPRGKKGGPGSRSGDPVTLEDFADRHGLGIRHMEIEEGVSRFPREIRLPACPDCGNSLFLSHPVLRADPSIEAKRQAGPLQDKVAPNQQWIAACWTVDCDFFLAFRLSELYKCPECAKYCMEGESLYDHMKHQCTDRASHPEVLKKAGVGRYIEVQLLGG